MYKICFVIPCFNHSQTLTKLCKILQQYKISIVVVNDGSKENIDEAVKGLNVIMLTHTKNQGKGAAVKTGYLWALDNNFTHIFQIDADMQHDLSVIPQMLELSQKEPKNLICGYGKYGDDMPKSRLYGRKITNFWVFINTLGGKFKDLMTGIRIYPLHKKIIEITKTNRMEFDIEILMNYYKFQIPFTWVEVAVRYGGISHFRQFKDNLLISKMHAKAFFTLPYYLIQRLKYGK